MLVQYEATTHKSAPTVLVGEVSTFKAKGKRAGRWKMKKGKGKVVAATASAERPCCPDGKGQREREGAGKKQKAKIRKLVESKSLEVDDLDNLSTCKSCLKRKMTNEPFVGKSAIANGLLDLIHIEGYTLETAAKLRNMAQSKTDEVVLEESSEAPQQNDATLFEPSVSTNDVPVLRKSTRESRPPERYGFIGLTSELDNNPRTYGEVMSDIDSDKWLEVMKFKIDSMGSNQVWTLVDPPKGIRPVGCNCVYKHKLGTDGEVTAFKARLVSKGYTQ
ncbi:hypothetical protein Sango_2757100 [Sesamum angolense]|uniref:Reverse transcriptase Ty1/copia-type domain-containing protein n=1 Tax=Sesamum angolense TaxID=2727404 RepID=A0AAE1VYK6_9LAMI|nr:hypothetical protein Sango_2757100 [Sesamum angolense]